MSLDLSVDHDEDLPHLEIPDPEEDEEDDDNEEANAHNIDFSFVYRNRALFDAFWETPAGFSDDEVDEDDEDVTGVEDSDDEFDEFGGIDWTKFGVGEDGDLSAWDQLGEGYDQEFASIRKSLWILAIDMHDQRFCSRGEAYCI
jgi:hypothetical protein